MVTFKDVQENLGEAKTSQGKSFVLIDVSCEVYRTYNFPDGSHYHIEKPVAVAIVGENNSHRVIDADGMTHYPKSNWIALEWRVEEGNKYFIA